MKLLIDNNLSYKLCLPLQTFFPVVDHVRAVLSNHADDETIWMFAKNNDYNILTKDNDFNELSFLKGCPPKIIHLLCGNKSTSTILHLILSNKDTIQSFSDNSANCVLKIYL